MSDVPNTLFLQLEGPLQAWGDNSKFVIRRTMEAPTKSGVIGLICCAMGLSRQAAAGCPIERPELRTLADRIIENPRDRNVLHLLGTFEIGARIDRPGTRWWDYHTVGAGYGLLTAEGKIKRTATTGEIETLVSRREYLCDASFLVVLQGDAELIQCVKDALENPRWPPFLGRKSCPPSTPVLARPRKGEMWTNPMRHDNLSAALRAVPWRPRLDRDKPKDKKIGLTCLVEWRASKNEPTAPADAEVWYDAPVSFDPPVHEPRLVVRDEVIVEIGDVLQHATLPPQRPQAGYSTSQWRKKIRPERLKQDDGLCVFCKSPATTVQHVTYRRAGGDEIPEDLRSLCRLCHDAVTMLEYGLGMGLDRIDPKEVRWREDIIRTRDEIRRWRSEEGRRRALRGAPERVRRELLEEDED